MKNRLSYYQHLLFIDDQKEYAEFLGVSQGQISKWKNQKEQPNTETLYKLWLKLKTKFPDIHLEDLLDPD